MSLKISIAKVRANSGRCIHSEQTPHYGVEIRQNRQHRWLTFGGSSIQSALDRTDASAITLVYMVSLLAGLRHFIDPQSLLLLGSGGGGLVRSLAALYPTLEQTIIEHDAVILNLAKQFFALPTTSKQHYIQASAGDYLARTESQYDCIISDIYGDESAPEELHSSSFYTHCQARLAETGLLVVNYICGDLDAIDTQLSQLRALFNEQILIVDIRNFNNVLVFAYQGQDFKAKLLALRQDKVAQQLELDARYGWVTENLNFE